MNKKEVRYVGESARSPYERGKEHLADYKNLSIKSHMLKHNIIYHKEMKSVKFKMEILEFHTTAFSRQIHEAVQIELVSKSGEIMNSKSEYNRCTIPRLTVEGGKSEEKSKTAGLHLTEEEVEAEIINLRKQRMKEIRSGDRDGRRSWQTGEMQERPRKRAKIDSELRKRTRKKSVVVEAPVRKKVKYEGVKVGEPSRSKCEDSYSVCTKEIVIGVEESTEKAAKITQLSRIFEENLVGNVKKPLGVKLSEIHSNLKPPLEKSVSAQKLSTSSPKTKRSSVHYPVKTKNTPKIKKKEIDRKGKGKNVKTLKDYFELKANGLGIEGSSLKNDRKN